MNLKKLFTLLCLICLSANLYSQLIITEFIASNASSDIDKTTGTYSDWIEIFNNTDKNINLKGYFLTDDIIDKTKWQFVNDVDIASGKYLVIKADGLNTATHTSFKLSSDGEAIALYSPSEELIDKIEFSSQTPDVSYGRKPDVSDNWVYFGEPTPGKSNTSIGYSTDVTAGDVNFSVSGGVYDAALTVELINAQSTGTIHYTTDCSAVTRNSPIYSVPVTINETKIIKARIFNDNLLPGRVITQTYFIGEDRHLPIISLTTAPDNLWDDEIGIYTTGTNGIIGFGGTTANYWQRDWERSANIEMFESDKTTAFNIPCGLAINGARRNMDQKSLRIFARNRYGAGQIDYKIFDDKEISSFNSLILRNGGLPDYSYTLIRDGLMQGLTAGQFDIDYQSHRPAVLFINGEYWGIYNIREKQNEDYLNANHKLTSEKLDILEFTNSVIDGEAEHYIALKKYIQYCDIDTDQAYDYIGSQMDINQFMNYIITQIFYANDDWPGNNIKFWRPQTEDGKWRWLLFDVDAGFGSAGTYAYNSIQHVTETENTYWANTPKSTMLMRRLFENQKFFNEFCQRFAAYMNTSFSTDRMIHFIDSMKNNINDEMPRHIERWKNSGPLDGDPIKSVKDWETDLKSLYEFAENRHIVVRDDINKKFELSGNVNINFNSENGKIFTSGIKLSGLDNQGIYFKDVPLILKAVPNVGYKFIGWQGVDAQIEDSIMIIPNKNLIITALFEPDNHNVLPAIIGSDLTLTKENSPYYANSDITIASNVTLSANAGVEIFMTERSNIIVNGNIKFTGTSDLPIKISPNKTIGAKEWGALCFDHSTAISELNNVVLIDASQRNDNEIFKASLSAYYSDINLKRVIIKSKLYQPFYATYGNVYIDDCQFECHVTCDFINVKHGTATVENSTFKGNEAPDTDAIDYDDITNGIIRNNKIFGFRGSNSDAIDLGEGAVDVLVENNMIFNCSDKGISIGQNSSAIIKNNIIFDCNLGIGIKDEGSYALVDRNTLFANNIAISCYEKNKDNGGGSASVISTIFADSHQANYFVDQYSSIEFGYSLSDTELISGEKNINSSPLFVNENLYDLRLQNNSPCIDTGSPISGIDSDGSPADMGADFTNITENPYSIVINEINYNSAADYDTDDWVELYNYGNKDIDMSAWMLKDSNNENTYSFPLGFVLKSNEYIVICCDKTKFTAIHPLVTNFRGNLPFGFSSNGENIRLFDVEMNLVSNIEYSDIEPWSSKTDGNGHTMQLAIDAHNSSDINNWNASRVKNGTPGRANTIPDYSNIHINEVMLSESFTENWIEIYNSSSKPVDIGGFYFTDTYSEPFQWMLTDDMPDSTIIGANSFMILQLNDNQEANIKNLGINFEQNQELGITAPYSLPFLDSISVPFNDGFSYGRIADGTGDFQFLQPTPSDFNNSIYLNQIEMSEVEFHLYPNPTIGQCELFIYPTQQIAPPLNISIYNLSGTKIYHESINEITSGINKSIDLSNFTDGIYIVQFSNNKTLKTVKLVLQKNR